MATDTANYVSKRLQRVAFALLCLVAAQLLLAGIVLAWARGRRLGPVVTEPLPVVVRAAESTQGRARLYRRGRSRDHAATALRRRSLRRASVVLGLPRGSTVDVVAPLVAARTGRSGPDVAVLLAGPPPSDDAALVRLADDLDALDQEVRRP